MAAFQDVVILGFENELINDEELLLLYDLQQSKNLYFPYWKYQRFDLDLLENDECIAEFRFFKEDILSLRNILQFPERFVCYNGTNVSSLEGLCIFLKRYAYPCRYSDLIFRFARPVPELCIIANHVMNFIYERWSFLLFDLNQPWLSPANLQRFSDAISNKGAPLENCWGFVDGTVRPICRPGEHQRIMYNGHKKVHSIKFQSVVAPNGIIANMYGPVEGRRHDSGMLGDSGLLNQLEQFAHNPDGNILCIYGDPAYPLRPQLLGPYKGARITPLQAQFNETMSQVRISVEWIFGDIINYFKFLDFKKGLKVHLSSVGKMYIVCSLMHNARACLYGNTTSKYFGLEPLELEGYFTP